MNKKLGEMWRVLGEEGRQPYNVGACLCSTTMPPPAQPVFHHNRTAATESLCAHVLMIPPAHLNCRRSRLQTRQ